MTVGLVKKKLELSIIGCLFAFRNQSHLGNMAEPGSFELVSLSVSTSSLSSRGEWYINLPDQTLNDVREEEIRMVLLGRTGAGKSATGNMIFGKQVFTEVPGPESATNENKVASFHLKGYEDIKFQMIDTPGLFDTSKDADTIEREIGRAIHTFHKGIHAFIYVHNPSERFTEEHRKTLKQIKVRRGPSFLEIVFVRSWHIPTDNMEVTWNSSNADDFKLT